MQDELGRYHLLRHLATGGMGEVYLAEAKGAAGFAKRLVIKTLRRELAADEQLVQQFVREGQLLEALDHPNIAQIQDLGRDGDTYFLAMEFVEGFDLRALQRALPLQDGETPRLSEKSVLYIVAAVARALEHAQTRRGPDGAPLKIVHHDVTPSNIMVRQDGHVKLVDFGVARSAVVHRLSAGALRGKLPYLSPEQANQQAVDGRADLFALGLCATELISGQRALDVTEPEALEDAYARLPQRLAGLTGRCGEQTIELISNLLGRDPAARPRDAGIVADRAEALLVQLGEASPARALAAELSPALRVLAAKAASFDQTLAQLVGVGGVSAVEATGTLSLPGIEVVQVAAASARDEAPVSATVVRRPWRKRLMTAAFLVLLAAVALGFWLGARRTPAPDEPSHAPTMQGTESPSGQNPSLAWKTQGVALPNPPTQLQGSVVLAAEKKTLSALELPIAVTAQQPPDAQARKATAHKLSHADVATGIVKFRVLPADCRVSIDGVLRRPDRTRNTYRLALVPGDHRLKIEDPDTGESKVIEIKQLCAQEERDIADTLLGGGLP